MVIPIIIPVQSGEFVNIPFCETVKIFLLLMGGLIFVAWIITRKGD